MSKHHSLQEFNAYNFPVFTVRLWDFYMAAWKGNKNRGFEQDNDNCQHVCYASELISTFSRSTSYGELGTSFQFSVGRGLSWACSPSSPYTYISNLLFCASQFFVQNVNIFVLFNFIPLLTIHPFS